MTPLTFENFTIKLAETDKEKRGFQDLVDDIFFSEKDYNANSPERKESIEKINPNCDLMIAIHNETQKVIGTYRLIQRKHAEKIGKFYTADEFDLSNILKYNGNILEFSRACVAKDFRSGGAIQAIWQGLGNYLKENKIDLLFGIPSLEGQDVNEYKETLSYLYHFHQAREEIQYRPKNYTSMNLISKDQINEKESFQKLAPLVKGYLRIGAKIGDGVSVDPEFNSISFGLLIELSKANPQYLKRFMGI